MTSCVCLLQLIAQPYPPGISSARLIKAGKTSETSRDKGRIYLCSHYAVNGFRKLSNFRSDRNNGLGWLGSVLFIGNTVFACFSSTFEAFLLWFLAELLDCQVKYFVSEMDKFIRQGAVIEGQHEHWRRDKSSLSVNLGRFCFLSSQRHWSQRGKCSISIPAHLWHDPRTPPEWNDDNLDGKWAMKCRTHRRLAKNNTALVGKWSKQSRWNKFELNYKQILDFSSS